MIVCIDVLFNVTLIEKLQKIVGDNNTEFSAFSNPSKDLSFFKSRVFFFFLSDP